VPSGFYNYMYGAIVPDVWWRMDEAAGNCQDSSGNAHHATLAENCTYQQAGAGMVGDSCHSILFNGANAYQLIPAAAWENVDYNENFFIGFWTKFTETDNLYLCSKWNGADTNIPYIVEVNSSKLKLTMRDASAHLDQHSTANALNNGAWHFCIARRVGTNLSWFVDGTWEAAAAQTVNTTTTNARDFLVGTRMGGGSWFAGYIQDFFFKKGTLTDGQGVTLWQLAKGRQSAYYYKNLYGI